MKKRVFLCAAITFCMLLTSCMRAGRPLELQLCGSYAVPGMLHRDMKDGGCSAEEIETDSEGRTLFRLSGKNLVYDAEAAYLVICQKIDAEYVYYYEDICFTEEGQSSEAIERLKERNDWGKPLDDSKMSRRRNLITFDLFISVDRKLDNIDVHTACYRALGVSDIPCDDIILLDVSPSGQELRFVRVDLPFKDDWQYVVLVSPDLKTNHVEITDLLQDWDKVVALKKDFQWG